MSRSYLSLWDKLLGNQRFANCTLHNCYLGTLHIISWASCCWWHLPLGNHLGHTQPALLSLGSRQGTQRHNYNFQHWETAPSILWLNQPMALKYSAVSAGQGLRVKLPQNHLNASSSLSGLNSLARKMRHLKKKKTYCIVFAASGQPATVWRPLAEPDLDIRWSIQNSRWSDDKMIR